MGSPKLLVVAGTFQVACTIFNNVAHLGGLHATYVRTRYTWFYIMSHTKGSCKAHK